MKSKTIITIVLGIVFGIISGVVPAHDEDHGSGMAPDKIGEVHFSIFCAAPAQAEFNRAMALFHSFWFTPAIQSFGKVLKDDPDCGMAYWGIALMSMGNPFAWPANQKAMENAATAMADAQRVGAKSPRERDYISALGSFFTDWRTVDFRSRSIALEKAMAQLAAKYPEDDEAQILYALVLDATALPTDKSFVNQRKVAAILEPLFRKYPSHPGVAHYLIHTYDYAELANEGLPAARAYGKIAPAVPYALHMPSHIYTRVGLWSETVDSNRASYQAAKAELSEKTLGVGTYDALHAMDYMVYAYLQLGNDKAANQLVEEVASINKINVENFVAAYALAAIPARYAIKRRDWRQAAALKLFPTDLAWN